MYRYIFKTNIVYYLYLLIHLTAVRRGCWYPDLFNSDPVLYAEPMNGCGFFADNLERTDTGKVYIMYNTCM